MVLSMEECQTLDILYQRCVGLDGSEYQRWVRLDGSEYGGMSNSRHTISKVCWSRWMVPSMEVSPVSFDSE